MAPADHEQGRYFYELLSASRADLEKRLAALHVQVMSFDGVGDQREARSKRRIIRALESEAHILDQMLKALRNRLGHALASPRLEPSSE